MASDSWAPTPAQPRRRYSGAGTQWSNTRARIAALTRSRPANDPELLELRAQFEAQRETFLREEHAKRLAAAVGRLVAEAPTLTEKQLAKLEAILKAAPREQAVR